MVYVCRPDDIDIVWPAGRRTGIPQYSLVEGIPPGEKKYPAIFNEKISRRSPYTFRYSNEECTITGIACLPVSKEIQSPDADVVEGGLNHSYVAIRLNPQLEDEYACQIIITGIERQPHRWQR